MAPIPKFKLSEHPVIVLIGVIAAIATICTCVMQIWGNPVPTPVPTNTPTLQMDTPTIIPETPTATLVTETVLPSAPEAQRGNFQDFDENNGTPTGQYCENVWYAQCSLQEDQGERMLRVIMTADAEGASGDEGGTVGINPASGDPIDLSSATKFYVWVLDTQGSNDIELRLCADTNCYPSEDGEGVWSDESKSVKDEWTKITWDLSRFPGLDKSNIRYIQIYEAHDGTYYFDNIGWE